MLYDVALTLTHPFTNTEECILATSLTPHTDPTLFRTHVNNYPLNGYTVSCFSVCCCCFVMVFYFNTPHLDLDWTFTCVTLLQFLNLTLNLGQTLLKLCHFLVIIWHKIRQSSTFKNENINFKIFHFTWSYCFSFCQKFFLKFVHVKFFL